MELKIRLFFIRERETTNLKSNWFVENLRHKRNGFWIITFYIPAFTRERSYCNQTTCKHFLHNERTLCKGQLEENNLISSETHAFLISAGNQRIMYLFYNEIPRRFHLSFKSNTLACELSQLRQILNSLWQR